MHTHKNTLKEIRINVFFFSACACVSFFYKYLQIYFPNKNVLSSEVTMEKKCYVVSIALFFILKKKKSGKSWVTFLYICKNLEMNSSQSFHYTFVFIF